VFLFYVIEVGGFLVGGFIDVGGFIHFLSWWFCIFLGSIL
jgi:hypothetical protein